MALSQEKLEELQKIKELEELQKLESDISKLKGLLIGEKSLSLKNVKNQLIAKNKEKTNERIKQLPFYKRTNKAKLKVNHEARTHAIKELQEYITPNTYYGSNDEKMIVNKHIELFKNVNFLIDILLVSGNKKQPVNYNRHYSFIANGLLYTLNKLYNNLIENYLYKYIIDLDLIDNIKKIYDSNNNKLEEYRNYIGKEIQRQTARKGGKSRRTRRTRRNKRSRR